LCKAAMLARRLMDFLGCLLFMSTYNTIAVLLGGGVAHDTVAGVIHIWSQSYKEHSNINLLNAEISVFLLDENGRGTVFCQ